MTVIPDLLEVLEKHKYLQMRGAFYGGVQDRPLGSGIIVRNCRIPFFDAASNRYRTGRGFACVITHECDIDPENNRAFNDKVIVAPIIDFKIWYQQALNTFGPQYAKQLAIDIVADQIYRVFFLPTIPNSNMNFGGFLYLNEITNTDVADLRENANAICSLSTYSFNILSIKIENHLLRPKSSQLMRVN